MSEPNAMSRRSLFQLVGLSSLGAAGVAAAGSGCAPAKPKAGSGSGTDSGGTGGEFHAGTLYLPIPQGNYNCAGQPFVKIPNAVLFSGNYGDLVMLPSAFYHWKEQTWDLYLIDSFDLDKASNTYTVKIKSGLSWSDGKPITAQDYLTTFWCQWVLGSPLWDYIDTIDAPDDQTFTMKMNQPAPVVERYLLHSNVIPTQQYGDIAAQARKIAEGGGSSSSKPAAALNTELVKYQPEKYIASGPFNIDYKTMNNTQLTLIKNTKGYAADRVKFDKIVIYNGETPEITPLVLSKDIDYATNGFPVASAKQFESLGYEILRPPTYSGPALFMSFDKQPEFKDPKVRQALNFAIDHDRNGTAALGPSGKSTKYYTGFSDFLVDSWIRTDAKSKLNAYGHDQDKAASMLESAGWKRSGNSWRLPNGKPAAYELLFPSDYADWSGAAKDLGEQLTAFGIPIKLRGVVSTQQPINVYKGDFQLAIQAWGNSAQPYPYFSFVAAFLNFNYPLAKNNGGKGMNYDLKRSIPGFGQVDIQKLIEATGSGTEQDALVANTTKLAQIFNAELPIIPLFERLGNSPALNGVRVKNFPSNDDPLITNSLYADNLVILAMLSGKLEPVAK